MITRKQTVKKYTVTAGVLTYGIPFPIYESGDVLVVWSSDGEGFDERTLIFGSDYGVSINSAGDGGTVTLKQDRVPIGATLAIVSNIPETQELALSHTSKVDTASTEKELDRQVQMIQQLSDTLSRCIKVNVTSGMTPEQLLETIFKAYRDIVDSLANTGSITGAIPVLATGSTEPRPLKDRFSDFVNIKDYGAKGDGVSDDTASFRAAVAAAQGRTIFVPSGSYVLTGHIDGGDFWSDKPIEYNDGLVTIDNLNSLAANKFQSSLDIKKIVDYSISSSEYKALQGICRHANIIYFSMIIDDTKQRIVSFNIYTQSVVKSADFTNLGHANSIAYRNGYLYISVMGNSIVKINAETLVQDSIFTLPYNAWRIGYDPISDRFAVAGNEFYIYDYNFSEISKRKIPVPSSEDAKQTTQGLAYYAGVLYVPYSAISSRKGIVQTNSVVAYNQSGSILNYWYIGGGYGELEDIEVDSKKITFGFNTDYETNVTFYEADYTRAAWEPNSLASIQADQYNIYTISTKEHTIYCDSEATALGDGTQERPFKRIKDAIQAIRNAKTKYSMLILQLTGNFSSEGPVFINALDQFLYIREGTLHSLYMYSCSAIRVAGVSFVGYPGNNYNNVYAEHSVVDFRNCNFYGDVEKSSAIVANRSDIYLTLPNYFYNHLYAGKIYSSDLTVSSNQSFSACQNTLTLYNETIARITPNSVDSHLRNDGTSIILTYGTK